MKEILGKTVQCYRFSVSPEGSVRSAGSRRILSLALVSIGLVIVLAWWWPGLTGHGERSEITIIGTGELFKAREEVSRRIRETGRSVSWTESVETWCEVSTLLDVAASQTVVLAPDDLRPCTDAGEMVGAEALSVHEARRLVVVAIEPSATVEVLVDEGASRVVTERLIGRVDEPRPCVWWEECPMSGTVVTRTETGLTDEGRQRLARLIAARLP